jgi:hypothetical protein
MDRRCTNCERPFTAQDLAKDVSKSMEGERKRSGLEGVHFRYYSCPACGQADIFVDVAPLSAETAEDFQSRRRELEETVRGLRAERVEVVFNDKRLRDIG